MSTKSLPVWLLFALPVLALMALLLATLLADLRWDPARPPEIDLEHLTADAEARPGGEVVVTGEWVWIGPGEEGHMQVALRGRNGGRVLCYFENVAAADRNELDRRLTTPDEATIRGRYHGFEHRHVILRGCRLLD